MDDAIKPALTPDEWTHARELKAEIDTLAFQLACVESDDFGAMAIANDRLSDDDPRKITRAKLTALDQMLQDAAVMHGDRCESGAEMVEASRDLRMTWELHAALAALLPTA